MRRALIGTLVVLACALPTACSNPAPEASLPPGTTTLNGVFDCGPIEGGQRKFLRFTLEGQMFSISVTDDADAVATAIEQMQPGSEVEIVGPYTVSGDRLTGQTVAVLNGNIVDYTGTVLAPDRISIRSESRSTGNVRNDECPRVAQP